MASASPRGGVKVPHAWTHGPYTLGSSTGSWRCIQEVVEFLFSLFTFIAVALLQLTYHFLSLPLNLGYVIVCELSPSGADLAFQLIPSALKNLRIHVNLPSLRIRTPVGEQMFCQFALA